MEKFWKWMEERGHTGSDRWLRPECADKQMLIGYMIEYLYEEGVIPEDPDYYNGSIKKYYIGLHDQIEVYNGNTTNNI
jgi:hypothetical protein